MNYTIISYNSAFMQCCFAPRFLFAQHKFPTLIFFMLFKLCIHLYFLVLNFVYTKYHFSFWSFSYLKVFGIQPFVSFYSSYLFLIQYVTLLIFIKSFFIFNCLFWIVIIMNIDSSRCGVYDLISLEIFEYNFNLILNNLKHQKNLNFNK